MKYLGFVLLAILAVIVVLLIIAVIHAIAIKAKPSSGKSSISYTPDEEAKYADRLSAMIQVPTVSLKTPEDLPRFTQLHEVMREKYPLIHEKLERIDIDGNLLYRWRGKNPSLEGIMLMGHQDVVPADESEWQHKPFAGDIADGKVHGRGAMDCKCTVMAEFSAVEELLEESFVPERDIWLSCSVNEEISGDGAPKLVKYLKDNGIRLNSVMDEGGAIVEGMLPGLKQRCAAIGTVEKGYADVKITARGAGGHSSTPPRNTPLVRLAAFITETEKVRPFDKQFTSPVVDMFKSVAPHMTFPMRLILGNYWLFKPIIGMALPKVSSFGEAFLSTTFAFTMCQGSPTPNVIPNEAYVICNIRPSIQQGRDESIEVLRRIAAKYDLEVELIKGRDASNITDSNGDEFKYIRECVAQCYPGTVVTPYYMSGGTDCRNYCEVSDNCLRFCPIRMSSQQLASMHAKDENISTDALAESVKFYKYYLENHK